MRDRWVEERLKDWERETILGLAAEIREMADKTDTDWWFIGWLEQEARKIK